MQKTEINHNKKLHAGNIFRDYGIFIILAATFIGASLISKNFLTPTNLVNVLRQIVPFGILACAETMLIVSGSLDLAAGSTMALAACVSARALQTTNSVFVAFIVAMAISILVNIISGILITKFHLPPFIATLAMMNIGEGAVNLYTNGRTATNLTQLRWLGQGRILEIPVMVWLFAILLFLLHILMKKTKFGLQMYAVGGNEKAAAAAGIDVGRQIRITFIIAGAITGVAAVVTCSRMLAAQPTVGPGYEFDAITATVVGGTGFTGGVGDVKAIIIGSLIIGIIDNVLVLIGISSSWQTIVQGLLIALAVALDLNTKRKIK